MRDLNELELSYVSGAGDCCSPCPPSPVPPKAKQKGNNGYGNGGSDGLNAGFQDSTR